MLSIIHTAIQGLLSLIFPDNCVGCGKRDELLCGDCILASKRQVRNRKSVLFLDHLYHWGIYEDKTLRSALRRFKYHGTRSLVEPLSEIMKEILSPHLPRLSAGTILIPIPAHERRKRERGYNQAELLAEKLSEKVNLPMRSDILYKTKNTTSQTSLSGTERIFNVKNSFAVAHPEDIKNKKIILVDDITTTGSTLSEAARVLKEAGAIEVTGLVVAI